MKTLLFIGLEFHNKTHSVDFLIDLLKENYAITFCYVDDSSEDPFAVISSIDGDEFDVLLCLQVLPPRDLLDHHVQFNHAAFSPMYDGCPSLTKVEKWWPYRDFNIICFSKALDAGLTTFGFSTKYIQFFTEPRNEPMYGEADSAFLWFRRENIGIPLVGQLFSKMGSQRLHVHNAPDPGNELVMPNDTGSMSCTFSTWYDDKRDMLRDIESCAYYISPREKEGIGMSFLEAMAMGKCVIAPNYPTMNEYIEHGTTGLLYNFKKIKPFDSVPLREIQKNTYQFACEGYLKWQKDKHQISAWLVEDVNVSRGKMVGAMALRFCRNPAKVIRAIRMGRRRSGR